MTINKKLQNQVPNIVPRFFPIYSANPKGKNYSLHCRYQLLKYKPWKNSFNDAWGSEDPSENIDISAWHEFLNTSFAKKHVLNWAEKLENGIESAVKISAEIIANERHDEEDWMMISRLHNDSTPGNGKIVHPDQYNWCLDRARYTQQQIAQMPKWIDTEKKENSIHSPHVLIDTTSFSQEQSLAYNIVVNHSASKSKEPLLSIVTGVAGTSKSYPINPLRNYLREKSSVTAITGKAPYAINGITIVLLLRLPIAQSSQKDLPGQCLLQLQNNLVNIQYITRNTCMQKPLASV